MTFQDVFDRTMGHEGGYVNDAQDPGGETRWGISKRSYPTTNIKDLTREDAKAIYERDFWGPVCSQLKWSIGFQVFDAAVNHGQGNAIRFLQRAVGVADDGHWGSQSLIAYMGSDENDVLMRFLAARLQFMTKLSTWERFGKGWARRIAENLVYAAGDNA